MTRLKIEVSGDYIRAGVSAQTLPPVEWTRYNPTQWVYWSPLSGETGLGGRIVAMDQRFPRREHLKRKRDFDRVFRDGATFHLGEISVRALPNGLTHSRLGLSVGRRHGGAVRRNRMKRLLREAYRLNRQMLRVPCDIVIVPSRQWRNLTLGAVDPTFRKALQNVERSFASE